MGERHFLGLLVVLSAAGAVWVSMTPEPVQAQIWIAGLIAVLGLAALANLNNVRQSGVLMPLYFIASILFALYVLLTRPYGIIMVSSGLLALVGLVLSFGIPAVAKAKAAKAKVEVAPGPAKSRGAAKKGRKKKK